MSAYKRCYFIFIIGSIGYCLLELLWRGYTHPSMGLAGGICLIGIYYINKLNTTPRIFRAFLCTSMITVVELVFGIILNIVLHLNVWDYSTLPFNFLGQICISFSLVWLSLSYCILTVLDLAKRRKETRSLHRTSI